MNLDEARAHFGVHEWGSRAPLAVRMLRHITDQQDCWVWLGATGYVTVRTGRHRGFATALAHREMYRTIRGEIPTGLELDHLCKRPSCINPAHLEPVTGHENKRRGTRATKTHCKHGHEFTPENTIINARGNRGCRECGRRHTRAYMARRHAETVGPRGDTISIAHEDAPI
jgi:hypothetical protein